MLLAAARHGLFVSAAAIIPISGSLSTAKRACVRPVRRLLGKNARKSVTIRPVQRLIFWKAGIVGIVQDELIYARKSDRSCDCLLEGVGLTAVFSGVNRCAADVGSKGERATDSTTVAPRKWMPGCHACRAYQDCIGTGRHRADRLEYVEDQELMAARPSEMASSLSQITGGEDANCFRVGTPIAGVRRRGTHGPGSSPTVSNRHTLWNLGVGMELAGDTKPTIANGIFAAHLCFDPSACHADIPVRHGIERGRLASRVAD